MSVEGVSFTCVHGHKPRLCHACHQQFCQLGHTERRGWGCDEGNHERCTGHTRGYETYRCDCICCCAYWPTPKQATS